jgi:hypothetical protein
MLPTADGLRIRPVPTERKQQERLPKSQSRRTAPPIRQRGERQSEGSSQLPISAPTIPIAASPISQGPDPRAISPAREVTGGHADQQNDDHTGRGPFAIEELRMNDRL